VRQCWERECRGRYTGRERGSGRHVRVPVLVRVRVAVRVCTHQIRLQPTAEPFSVLAKPHLGRSRVLDERARFRSMSVSIVARAVVRS
jgi:hypothetical protein